VLNLASVLIALRRCHLQVQNLDRIIIIINNSPNHPHMNVTFNVDLEDYLKAKINVTKENFELIKEVEHFEKLQIDEE